jgi:protein subunit release factor B
MHFLSLVPRLALARASTSVRIQHATFHNTPALFSKALPPRPVLLDSDLIENFLKGSGPGGQKINKTSSAVQLKHIPTGIVVKYQDTRSREVNRKMARRILQDRIEEMELGDDARTRVKAREKSMKKARATKKSRRKYKALEEAKQSAREDDSVDEDVVLEETEEQAAAPDSVRVSDSGKAAGG